ncbi:MAG: ABC transporter ATP-binding protein [Lachnospiraceae bacterium]
MNKIELQHISKSYGETTALEDINLVLEENKIYGLLGRNGAGKTTLLNLIANRIFPDQGTILVNEKSTVKNDMAQSPIYLTSEKNLFPSRMMVCDGFRLTGTFYRNFDLDFANQAAQLFELDRYKKIRNLSTGYVSIFKMIVALSTNAPFILLDEPTLGVDAEHRELFYQLLIERYAKQPSCVILSTHLIEEAANILEEVVILKEGHMIRNQSCESLLEQGYAITGAAGEIDHYIQDKQVLGIDTLGNLKAAYILGAVDTEKIPDVLEISKLDLQKLFVKLTNV